jgi:hypothetical protein
MSRRTTGPRSQPLLSQTEVQPQRLPEYFINNMGQCRLMIPLAWSHRPPRRSPPPKKKKRLRRPSLAGHPRKCSSRHPE